MTRCAYAEFYRELGEPELGFLLCTADFATADGFGPDIRARKCGSVAGHAVAPHSVIASAAKQSRIFPRVAVWIASLRSQ
ncbi:L-2-amino-thiazoline-4-carboxylic acid hydrolase [Bradyrhizobium liaoningense]|uniref:L-2-amino-thiazoline-4-carboxylic acid hydrolase n=1 Tax=Bradyrhizobium liaoningense TaxID=43992 RepID=UPI003D9B6FB4